LEVLMMRRTWVAALAVGVLSLAFTARAWTGQDRKTDDRTRAAAQQNQQRGTPAAQTGAKAKMPLDEEFLVEAFGGSNKEIVLGRLAEKQAKNEKVREFGQRMVRDHTKASQRIAEVLKAKNRNLVEGTAKGIDRERDQLAKFQGEGFDKAYMQHMLKDHEEDVAAFENQAKNGKDPACVNLAKEMLPTLREHLQMARQIAAQVGAARGTGTIRER
jgi:putative membrane protein